MDFPLPQEVCWMFLMEAGEVFEKTSRGEMAGHVEVLRCFKHLVVDNELWLKISPQKLIRTSFLHYFWAKAISAK